MRRRRSQQLQGAALAALPALAASSLATCPSLASALKMRASTWAGALGAACCGAETVGA